MNNCLYRKIGDQSTVCTADDVATICIFLHKHINLKPALCTSVFARAPETFMFNAFDIRGKSRFFPFYVRCERQKPRITAPFTTSRKQCTI